MSKLLRSFINVQTNKYTKKENYKNYIIKTCPVKVINNDKETVRGFEQASYPAASDQCYNLKLN